MNQLSMIFLKNELIDPDKLAPPDDSLSQLEVCKHALMKEFKVLLWSKKLNKWVYVLYDDAEVAKVQQQLPNTVCFSLTELWLIKGLPIDEPSLSRIAEAKRVFGAKITKVSTLQGKEK